MPKIKKKTKSSNVLKFSFTETLIAICKGLKESLAFWIPHRGFRIASLSVNQSGFLELYSRFQSPGFQIAQANFPGFWIPQAKISWIPESVFPYMRQSQRISRDKICN